jgi:hypothetical protein
MDLLRYQWRTGYRAYFCGVRIPLWLADYHVEIVTAGLWLLILAGVGLGLVLVIR